MELLATSLPLATIYKLLADYERVPEARSTQGVYKLETDFVRGGPRAPKLLPRAAIYNLRIGETRYTGTEAGELALRQGRAGSTTGSARAEEEPHLAAWRAAADSTTCDPSPYSHSSYSPSSYSPSSYSPSSYSWRGANEVLRCWRGGGEVLPLPGKPLPDLQGPDPGATPPESETLLLASKIDTLATIYLLNDAEQLANCGRADCEELPVPATTDHKGGEERLAGEVSARCQRGADEVLVRCWRAAGEGEPGAGPAFLTTTDERRRGAGEPPAAPPVMELLATSLPLATVYKLLADYERVPEARSAQGVYKLETDFVRGGPRAPKLLPRAIYNLRFEEAQDVVPTGRPAGRAETRYTGTAGVSGGPHPISGAAAPTGQVSPTRAASSSPVPELNVKEHDSDEDADSCPATKEEKAEVGISSIKNSGHRTSDATTGGTKSLSPLWGDEDSEPEPADRLEGATCGWDPDLPLATIDLLNDAEELVNCELADLLLVGHVNKRAALLVLVPLTARPEEGLALAQCRGQEARRK
jgi:hypothetical protein